MNKKSIGVIGAGVIGIGVAQSLAQSDYQVVLIDNSIEKLDKSRQEIKKNARAYRLLKVGGQHLKSEAVVNNIQFSSGYDSLAACDFIIENVTEKWNIKKEVYSVIDRVCPQHTIFAANTSAIPITKIAAATNRPSQVIGMHFMNPVPLKTTVEVIRGYHTSEQTIAIALDLLASLGKEGILVNDAPGFVTNRVLMLTINEAVFLLQEGVSTAQDIDRLFKNCFGHKMGPLETADLIGLDTILYSIEVLYEHFADSKYRPCPLLARMVEAGLLGRKSGKGFYSYNLGEA